MGSRSGRPSGRPDAHASPLPADTTQFAHNAERQLAKLLDFYGTEWHYEPHTFVLARDPDGKIAEAFSPDFYLPTHRRYLEVTTLRQALVTRKNRKVRQLRELYPHIDIQIIYQRDYQHLLVRYGLETPEQQRDATQAHAPGVRATEESGGLLELGPIGPTHPSSPTFRQAG